HRANSTLLLVPALLAACAGGGDGRTLAALDKAKPDLAEVRVENSLDQAMVGYQKYLDEAPESSLTPEAMRRLADLKLEKEYGPLGASSPSTHSSDPGAPEPKQAIALYDRILATYPNYEHNDEVLYQKARAYDELGQIDEAVGVVEQLIARYPA